MIDDILNDTAKLNFVAISFALFSDLVIAIVLFATTKRFVSNSRAVLARITRLQSRGNATTAYLSLKNPLGKAIDATLIVPANAYKENQEIEILSHKDNPAKVKVNSYQSLWLLPVTLLHGAVFLGVVLGVLVSMDIVRLPF